ncbi:MAG: hypothetical protein A2655_02335 [Candidatus Yanofskybacteria bacterium RIFCSPHIGHO2_01_FULL_43_42]|uniref:CBS domain-containing protein n=1 Tax=Candidatus Yanofskybacteria bacterium RIFCSPLOWO2_01_FULL_43_22 TaxID=1802695 RepID=A0A1F8GGH4_9BACT|nr:MAG: hypothetical protein A2655_02335 [Candidatus Yanofskybacteria bacterium RIFCSPHIGHO2_01_FULL_43_42]OGN13358.1 MAG: hypothetical protein A3D48_00715 [Candidatus Yanofskybacteria bacterium RIFCSPHIGHO2_02_FULL_43_17]OGN24403.1 MAG: hypothetical protein A3A13_01670 [Candidatus Yanofskybacteria bacterium RIFCSPLOWO2_01_FULL_43_22]
MRSEQDDRWLRSELRGHAFDDFLNPPGWGKVKTRKGISLATNFSQHIGLNIPIVSANMDTITRARMAIAMAKEGGIGIIERYLSIEEQCDEIREVKRKESHIILQPHNISKNGTIAQAKELMERNKVGCLVILDESGKLLGLLSHRDVRFARDNDSVANRMKPVERLVTASPDTTLNQAKKLLDKSRLEKLPLVDEGFKLVGLITAKDIENLDRYPLANKDINGRLVVGAAVGAVGDFLERSSELVKAGVDVIVMDIANFQSEPGIEAVRKFRRKFPDTELVVGNVVLPEAVEIYQRFGVNGVKVGLGPGSACTTRYNTNIGVTQAQAIYECARVAKIPVIADGGIKRDGHISLALLLGGDSVMIGGLFASTDETPGLVFRKSTGQSVKSFRGMASREAMHQKLKAEEADDPYEISSRMSPEGIEKEVEARGSVVPIVREMAGHIASMISYIGGRTLIEAQGIFMANPSKYLVKLSEAAKKESFDR